MSCVGSRVKYIGNVYGMFCKEATVIEEYPNFVQIEFDNGIIFDVYKKDIIIIERNDNMAKLEGYKAVAVTKEGYYEKKYSYAIYSDGETYKAGDKIVVSGANKGVLTIEEILTPEECNASITAEVICKVDTSAYDKRVEERKEKAERKKEADKIKKQMDKMITEMDQTKRYEMYASDNPELAEKLKAYKELIGE
ncbi:hypothetical protein [Blautia wexlerae]|uniref:hypothetical protein n=1 Tax=Blautia wexlerae TaxID=418240 RepID=UPI00156E3BFA|nr:hypothetical protein [Blautia wexlerae]NSD49031.1 hypothetical protein [Blautia wexlerae]NSD50598.1 hypothetical protein [Blautia wexlerae]NSK03126.1 hypothetical protein [Blautia wexlerae]NSK40069.1 hypothetical protein [Blautia wexlerae]